jgi:hypothetical protein
MAPHGLFSTEGAQPVKRCHTLLELSAFVALTFVSGSSMQPANANSPSGDSVSSIAALQAFAAHSSGTTLNVVGYYAGSTHGGGQFIWDAINDSTPNLCTIFQIRGNSTGRWVRKLNGSLDVSMCGAKQDSFSDDTLPIQTALNIVSKYGGTVIINNRPTCAIVTSVLQIGSNTKLAGIGYPCVQFTAAATSGEITFAGSNSVISGLAVTSGGALGIQLGCRAANCSNVSIKDNIYNRPGKIGPIIALNDAGATWKNISITDNFLVGGSYGILANSTQHGSGLAITNNFIGGVDADAIELNTTSNNWTDTAITGNVLDSSAATTPPAAGFGIGIARGLRVTVAGNAILGSAHHGIHIEDGSSDITVTGNIIAAVARGRNGIDLLQNTVVPVKRIIITDNTLRAAIPGTGIGIASNYTRSGIPSNTLVSGNVIDDFGTGIWTLGSDPVFNNKIFSSQSHFTGIFAIQEATQAIRNNSIVSTAASCVACVPVFANNGGQWGPVTVTGHTESDYITVKQERMVVTARIASYKRYVCARKPKLTAKMAALCKVN